MKKGLSSTDSPDDKNFNPIVPFESELENAKFKELAILFALREVARQNDLSLKQQSEIINPQHSTYKFLCSFKFYRHYFFFFKKF